MISFAHGPLDLSVAIDEIVTRCAMPDVGVDVVRDAVTRRLNGEREIAIQPGEPLNEKPPRLTVTIEYWPLADG